MASPITIFRKAWELRKHKVAALRDVPKTEQNLLGTPKRKKVMYNRGEKEKLEELETSKPHDLAENWPHATPAHRAPAPQLRARDHL